LFGTSPGPGAGGVSYGELVAASEEIGLALFGADSSARDGLATTIRVAAERFLSPTASSEGPGDVFGGFDHALGVELERGSDGKRGRR